MPLYSQRNSKLSSIPLIVTFLSLAGLGILVRVRSFSSYSRTIKPVSLATTTSSTSMSSSSATEIGSVRWKPLGPEIFSSVISSEDGGRYAKDDEYLGAVLDSWTQDATTRATKSGQPAVETSPWIYHDDDNTPLYGHVVRPTMTDDADSSSNDDDDDRPGSRFLPGILLFHTAAGPQDVFLFQMAAKLATAPELGGCVVFVCDVLSDPDGWAWTPDGDRTPFNEAKDELLRDNARVLRSRVKAAVRAIVGGGFGVDVDPNRLAALGWCFGAQPILELATLQHEQDRAAATAGVEDGAELVFSAVALVSYHGVYRRDPSQMQSLPPIDREGGDLLPVVAERDVLICTGRSDPFVAPEDLEFAKAAMEERSYNAKILEFDGAKHGFTNPAQDFNANPAFEYNEHAATKSWEATIEVLKRRLLVLSS